MPRIKTKKSSKTIVGNLPVIITSIAAIMGLLWGLTNLYDRWLREPLVLSITPIIQQRVFHRVWNTVPPIEHHAEPILSFLYVRLNNEGPRNITIKSYSVSILVNGEWEPLSPLGSLAATPGSVVTLWREPGQRHSTHFQIQDLEAVGFDLKARQPLAPNGGLIEGWIYFGNAPSSHVTKMRITFLDTENASHTLTQVYPETVGNLRPPELRVKAGLLPIPDELKSYAEFQDQFEFQQ